LSLAGARVARKCRAVLEQGARLRNQKDAAAFHSLRIECKQLRYLMEILGDLMPEAKGAVQRLKKLQDALGRIQDLTVHEARTQDFAQAMSAAGDGRALPAAEVLVSRMRVQRELACARVPELFAQFSRSLRETEPPYVMLLPWLRRIQDD
jgi:CHAD domain-containing protein